MSRRLFFTLWAALVFAPSIRSDDTIDDLRKFDGTWSMVALEMNGMPASAQDIKATTVVFDQGRYEVKEGEKIVESGSLKLDASKTPRTVNFKILKGDGAGKDQLGIYQFDRETLKLCVSIPPGSTVRPITMTTKPESQTLLMVMKKKSE